jgi:hypothetical protein
LTQVGDPAETFRLVLHILTAEENSQNRQVIEEEGKKINLALQSATVSGRGTFTSNPCYSFVGGNML